MNAEEGRILLESMDSLNETLVDISHYIGRIARVLEGPQGQPDNVLFGIDTSIINDPVDLPPKRSRVEIYGDVSEVNEKGLKFLEWALKAGIPPSEIIVEGSRIVTDTTVVQRYKHGG